MFQCLLVCVQADPNSVDPGKLSPSRVRRSGGRSMSVQSSLDPCGSNTTLSSSASSDAISSDKPSSNQSFHIFWMDRAVQYNCSTIFFCYNGLLIILLRKAIVKLFWISNLLSNFTKLLVFVFVFVFGGQLKEAFLTLFLFLLSYYHDFINMRLSFIKALDLQRQ